MTEQPFKSNVAPGMPEEPKTPGRLEWETKLRFGEGKVQPKEYPQYSDFIPKDERGQPTTFKPALVAQWLTENENFKTDRKTEILYYGDPVKGIWKRDGETYLKEIITKILRQDKKNHFNNILHTLTSLTYCDIEFSQKIAVENGLLNVETGELTPFTLKEMAFYEIPTTYNKEADCQNFKEFLKQILPSEEDRQTLQEWSGFLLLPDYREHKILWCHGGGRNGKGAWARTMEGIIGADNCSEVPLNQFDGYHRFAMERLYGKLFNQCSEPAIGKKKVLQTSLLKAATGQDTIEAEIKGKQKTVKFRNCAKITVMANQFPKVEDNTTAFKERRLFITFPNEYIGADKINDIEKIWLEDPIERMGILNWMLEGLHRLLANGYFTEGKTQQETETLFLRASDTIGAFITEMVVFDKTKAKYKGRKETFEAYKEYCDYYGLDNETEKAVTQRLKDTKGVTEGKRFIQSLGRRDRAWVGLDLKPLPEEKDPPPDNPKKVTGGTDGTASMDEYISANSTEDSKLKESKACVPNVPSVPPEKIVNVYKVFNGEPCDCGEPFEVQVELHDTVENTRKRCCVACAKKEKKRLFDNGYSLVYPSLGELEE